MIPFSWSSAASTAETQPLSVPAEFVKQLVLPGSTDQFLRPSAISIDRHFREIYVADPGNNRIVILDEHGTYRYEFAGGERFSVPIDLVVDSEGIIYVLGSTRNGYRIFAFDFDGVFRNELAISDELDGQPIEIYSIAIDEQDNLYALDRAGLRVCTFDREGRLGHAFPILGDMEEGLRVEQTLGSIEVRDGRIFVPVASLGSVYVFGSDGAFLQMIGHKGSNTGALNFPIAVAVTDDGLVMVLDKHRFNVVCFNVGGRFYGEFGGRGASPGWFYHPTLLAVDDKDQVYIGQVFQNKVQVCRIPEFIRAAHLRNRIDLKQTEDLGSIPREIDTQGPTSNKKEGFYPANREQATSVFRLSCDVRLGF